MGINKMSNNDRKPSKLAIFGLIVSVAVPVLFSSVFIAKMPGRLRKTESMND
jgi:hypothetical protein